MEKYIFEFHKAIADLHKTVKEKYNRFLESNFFWFIALLIIPTFLLQYNLFFFRESLYFFVIYLLLTIIILGLLMPPIIYKIKGLDFFVLKKKYFQKEKIKSANEESIENSFSAELTEYLYYIMHDECRILDITIVSDKFDGLQDHPNLFSQNYIVDCVNNLRCINIQMCVFI